MESAWQSYAVHFGPVETGSVQERKNMKKLLKEPLLHFPALGAEIFALNAWREKTRLQVASATQIEVTAAVINRLRAGYERQGMARPRESSIKRKTNKPMKMKPLKSLVALSAEVGLFAAILLVFTACSSTPKQSADSAPSTTAPILDDTSGEVQIEAVTVNVTVISIDYPSRQVVLRRADGTLVSCRVGPQAVNFDKVKVGDEIRATVAEKYVTFISKNGAKSGVNAEAVVVRVLVNGVPSAMAVSNVELEARVLDVDLESRRMLLEVSKGDAQSFLAAPAVSLTNIRDGDQIRVRISDAVAITVERP